MLEGGTAGGAQLQVVAGDLGGAADADAVSETGDGDLVGLVHHCRDRSLAGVRDRYGDRIALDRIDRDRLADPAHPQRRIGAHGHDVGVGCALARAGRDAGDPAAFGADRLDGRAVFEGHAARGAHLGQPGGEHLAIAGLVARQTQPADEFFAHRGQSRLGGDAARGVEDLERHAVLSQNLDVAADAVELLLLAEELERALRALVIGDAGGGAQRLEDIAAVFGQRHHARLVERIASGRAVRKHPEDP